MIVVACPGQGSQTPGFLTPWLELDGVRERVQAFSDAAKVDLLAHGTESDADTIRDTSIAQPLIVAASLIAWQALGEARGRAAGVAGHSVGEVAALAIADVIDGDRALALVGERGRAMSSAAAEEATGMSAIVGGVEEDVLQRIAAHDLQPANFNGGGQIVAAGSLTGLAELAEDAPRGARVIPLQVAGAFHTRYMEHARPVLQAAVDAAEVGGPVGTPDKLLWTNSDGSLVTDGMRALELIVHQVTSPVRWDLCMAGMIDREITGMIELTPAGALTGLAKRGMRGVPTVAVKTPDDLEAAVALLNGENE
ncbi:ACP S-malonyltransferase [Microbacterium gorillae]|uniref:ACP S-malonyltransferase n=1 Tax=Microbacterium gorillae TaxID=1231063 RepID=UPI00058E83F8|nr:ACP S-malonyltransferase [Microbacterium gorillae]